MSYYIVFGPDNTLITRLPIGAKDTPPEAVKVTAELWMRTINETDGVWTLDKNGTVNKKPLPAPVPDYPTIIAQERYRREVGGTTFNEMHLETDDRSKTLIMGAAFKALRDPSFVLNWKTPSGFVDIPAERVLLMAEKLNDHVQACFDRESALLIALDQGSFTVEMLGEGWPE